MEILRSLQIEARKSGYRLPENRPAITGESVMRCPRRESNGLSRESKTTLEKTLLSTDDPFCD
jgi:hypothetical protein